MRLDAVRIQFTVRPTGHNGGMAITMHSYGLTWTDRDGTARASGVSYDQASAEHRKGELETAGATDVEIVPVTPGERLQPKG
jgi:hypothetical protein